MHDTSTSGSITRIDAARQWITGAVAADRLGVSLRTLQRMASRGEVERQRRGTRSYFRINETDLHDKRDTTDARQAPSTTRHATPRATSDEGALAALREELTALRVATIDAERRAAVAEYRAQLAETDPAEVEALRARIAETVAERDEARAEAVKLGAAMVKRHSIIQRLTRALTAAQGASK